MIVTSIENRVLFGKHASKSIKEIALIDPKYIEWMCSVDSFIFSENIIDQLSDYCLGIFLEDPIRYLTDDKFKYTRVFQQEIKHKDITISVSDGKILVNNIKYALNSIKPQNWNDLTQEVFVISFRKIFDGAKCKSILSQRKFLNL